ncbi:MAG: tripartite tricarboxylate transporter substrate binding protein [Burkholderiales bacterium]|nr:tripartite tricarboxylate transporter substrate binding protein [Burkholderiales bacterium]
MSITLPKRQFTAALVSLLSCAVCPAAFAQTLSPAKPITIVVPFAAGGGSDITARLIAQKLSEDLKQAVIVENKPGASTQIGTSYVIRSAPDGHTLLLGTTSLINNVHLNSSMPYDASRDLRPVAPLVDVPALLIVGPSVKAKNTREFLQAARSRSNGLNFGSAGAGSTLHLAGEWLRANAGFEATHVPYKGSGPAVTALAAGEVDFGMENLGPARGQMQAGRLRVLAIAAPQRFPSLPDVPTLAEAGLPSVDLSSWFVLMAPAATPDAIVNDLNQRINAILKQADVRTRLLELGMAPTGGSTQEMLDRMRQDSGKWGAIIRGAKISVN